MQVSSGNHRRGEGQRRAGREKDRGNGASGWYEAGAKGAVGGEKEKKEGSTRPGNYNTRGGERRGARRSERGLVYLSF